MLIQPVIEREIRVQARARGTYWLRVLAAGLASLVFGIAMSYLDHTAGGLGVHLFTVLHVAICAVLALVCPFLTADTIARERREGTLGLLLLTPLRPGAVIVGKLSVHLARAFTLWVSILPILSLPFMLGGLRSADIGIALLFELTLVMAGLASGLLASCLADRAGAVMTLAALFNVLICLALVIVFHVVVMLTLSNGTNGTRFFDARWFAGALSFVSGIDFGRYGGFSAHLSRLSPAQRTAIVESIATMVAGSAILLLAAGWYATRHVRQYGQVRRRSERRESLVKFLFRPLAPRRHSHARRNVLANNPLLWLYTLKPAFRLNRWGWCVLVLLWSGIISLGFTEPEPLASLHSAPMILTGAMVLACTMAFAREMEEGGLELLLATPLEPSSILWARVHSLWLDFFPALAFSSIIGCAWIHLRSNNYYGSPGDYALLVGTWSTFACAPFIAVRFAIRRVTPIISLVWTAFFALVIPATFASILLMNMNASRWQYMNGYRAQNQAYLFIYSVGFAIAQIALAMFASSTIIADLESRRFQLKPLQKLPR